MGDSDSFVTMQLEYVVVNPRPYFGLDELVLRTVSGAMLATRPLSGGAGAA